MVTPTSYDIEDAATELGFSAMYIRVLVHSGRLNSTMEPITPGSLVTKHVITAEELERFRNEVPHKSKRADGRNKFIIYLLPTEIAPARKALEKAGLPEVASGIRPSNRLKGYTPPTKGGKK
jgi:hypothetical protein